MTKQNQALLRRALGLSLAVGGAGCIITAATMVALPLGLATGGVCLVYVAKAMVE